MRAVAYTYCVCPLALQVYQVALWRWLVKSLEPGNPPFTVAKMTVNTPHYLTPRELTPNYLTRPRLCHPLFHVHSPQF